MYNIYIMGQPISSQQPNGYDDISGDGRRYIDARSSPLFLLYTIVMIACVILMVYVSFPCKTV